MGVCGNSHILAHTTAIAGLFFIFERYANRITLIARALWLPPKYLFRPPLSHTVAVFFLFITPRITGGYMGLWCDIKMISSTVRHQKTTRAILH